MEFLRCGVTLSPSSTVWRRRASEPGILVPGPWLFASVGKVAGRTIHSKCEAQLAQLAQENVFDLSFNGHHLLFGKLNWEMHAEHRRTG